MPLLEEELLVAGCVLELASNGATTINRRSSLLCELSRFRRRCCTALICSLEANSWFTVCRFLGYEGYECRLAARVNDIVWSIGHGCFAVRVIRRARIIIVARDCVQDGKLCAWSALSSWSLLHGRNCPSFRLSAAGEQTLRRGPRGSCNLSACVSEKARKLVSLA